MKTLDIETIGLNPMEDRIICISISNIDSEAIKTIYGEDESVTLETFWNWIDNNEQVLTYNGDSFDIPFIITRSLINKVKIKKLKNTDLRKVVTSFFTSYNKYAKGKLSDWATILNIEIKTEDGEKMKEFFENKEWSKIKEHCEEDIIITKALYKRCKECELI